MEGYDVILTNLRIKDVVDIGGLFGSTQSPTITVSINEQSFSTIRARHGRTEANFTEEFVFHLLPSIAIDDQKIRISVFNESSKGVKTSIGNGEISLRDLLKVPPADLLPVDGSAQDIIVNLTHMMKTNKEHNKGKFSAHMKVQYRSSDANAPSLSSTKEEISTVHKSTVTKLAEESNPVHSTTIDIMTETPKDSNSKTVKPDENNLKDSDKDHSTFSVVDNPQSIEGVAEIKSADGHSTNIATIPEIKAVIAEKGPSVDAKKEVSPIGVVATTSSLAAHTNITNFDVTIREPVSGNQSLGKRCHVVLSKLSVTAMMQGQGEDILGKESMLSIQIGDEKKSTRVYQDLVSQEWSFSLLSDPKDVQVVASLRSDIVAQENLTHLFPTLSKPVAFTLYLSEVNKSPPPLQQLTSTDKSEPTTSTGNIYARLDGMGIVTFDNPDPTPQPVENKTKKVESIGNDKSGGSPIPTTEKVESTSSIQKQDKQKEVAQSGNVSIVADSLGSNNASTFGIAISDSPSVGAANPGHSDQVPTATTSQPAATTTEASTAAIIVSKDSGVGLSSKSKRLLAEADGSIGRHRKAYSVTDPVVNAIKIQALWRGKRIRRILRRQNTAAIIIQRIVRGNLTRWTEGNYLTRAKVHKELKGESNARLRRIRQQERSLHMLRSLPAKDVGDLTRLEQQRAASTIQRIWRSGRDARIRSPPDRSSRSKSSVRNPGYAFIVKKFAKMKAKSAQPDLERENNSKAKEDVGSGEDVALTERKAKLQEYIHRNLIIDTPQPNPAKTDKLSINLEPNLNVLSENDRIYQNTHEYRVEVDALKLAQLQRRIKEAAAKKYVMKDIKQADMGRDLNSTIGHVDRDDREGARFGARRKYQQMLEEQQKATILLQEHFAAADEMIQRQIARQDTLGHCQYLVKQLTSPLSLDEAAEALQDIKEQPNDESNWSRRDYLGKYPVHEKKRSDPDPADSSSPLISSTYIDAHFQTVAALRRDRQGWGSVIVPYNDIFNNPEIGLGSDWIGAGSQMKAKSSFLANVANVNVKLSKSIETFADPFSSRQKGSHTLLPRHGRLPADTQVRGSADRAPRNLPRAVGGGGGSDLEDSLYWISYATQPSHVTPAALNSDQASIADHPDRNGATRVKGDGRPDADTNQYLLNKLNPTQEQRQLQHAALRTQISTEVMSASLRKDRIKQQCADDYNKVDRLATLYQNEILNILEKENRVRAQQDMSEQEKQLRLNAVVRIQAAIRGKSSRMHTAGLKAQRRVISALQVLLKEIGYAENTKNRMDSRNIPSYKPHSMDPSIILGSIRRNLVDNNSVYTSLEKPQQINRRSKDTASQPTLLPTQSSRTPQKSVHYEATSLLRGSSGGITDKLGHPPVVRNLTFSPSTSKMKLATDYSHSNLEDRQNFPGESEDVHSFHSRVPPIALDQPDTLSPRNIEQPALTPIRNPNTEFFSPDAHPTLAESNSNLLGSGGSANLSVYSPAQGELTGYISSPSQSHNSLSHSGAQPFPNPTNPNLASTQNTNNQSSKKSLLAREPSLKEADNENDSDSESPHQKNNQSSLLMSPPDRTNSSIEQTKIALMSIPAGSGWQGKQQEDQVRSTMEKVEDLFRRNYCSVEAYLPSALVADVARFDKEVSYRILDNLVMVCGVHLVGQFLQRFVHNSSSSPNEKPTSNPNPSPQSNSSSAIVLMGEVEVETAAMVLVQLSTELGVMSLLFSSGRQERDYADLTLTECVTQLCIWLRLLGSGSSSGLVSIAEVISLLEDRWMRGVNLPHDAERAMHEIALCRYRLLLKATRLSSSSVKVLDEAVEAIVEDNRRRGNRTRADSLTFADIQSIIESWLSSERGSPTSELAAAIGRLCQFNPNPNPNSVTVTQLMLFLCRLCSFRTLQMRIQVWFRAVPTMYLSLLQLLHSMHPNLSAASPAPNAKKSSTVSRSVFIRACQQSELPLCMAEVIMLAELLSRRRNVDGGSKSSSRKEGSETDDMVDISLLNLIKKGELLNAPLS